ncbi:Or9e65CTE, partial [Eciton burchellii]
MTICIENHFSLNKILLRIAGLWPYHRTKLIEFHHFFFSAILASFIIVQFTTFITTQCTTDIVIKIFCFTSYYIIYPVLYNSVYINADTVRCMLEKLQYICNELKNEDEIAIIKKYGNDSKRLTFVISLYCVANLSVFILLPTFPKIIGIFILNTSETNLMLHVRREYFVDQERYSYLILLHLDAAMCIGSISILATGTLLISLLKHYCGIFKIA